MSKSIFSLKSKYWNAWVKSLPVLKTYLGQVVEKQVSVKPGLKSLTLG